MHGFLSPSNTPSTHRGVSGFRKIEPHVFCHSWEEMRAFESRATNLVVLKRSVPNCLRALEELVYHSTGFAQTSLDRNMNLALIPALLDEDLDLQAEDSLNLYADIESLAQHFFSLTGAKTIGVRIERVDTDKCRSLHVDFVSARLVTTYLGQGTQWLRNQDVNRSFLGQEDNSSVQVRGSEIQNFEAGWVGLMKGEKGNEGAGLVHRSPPIELTGSARVLLRMDVLA